MDRPAGSWAGDETTQLQEKLRTCQSELARLRVEEERWAHELHEERARSRLVEERFLQLSLAADRLLERTDELTRRDSPRWSRRREADDDGTVERVSSSDAFRGPWYIRQHPEVLDTGMSPARHYVEEGAAQGWNPGPSFDTAEYLAAHPEIADGSQNPLVHYLETYGDDD